MFVQVALLEARPEYLETILAEIQINAAASRQEPGVLQFDVLQQQDEPLKFMLYEVYTAPEALEAHRATVHFKRWLEKGVPHLSGRAVVKYNRLD